MLHGGEATLTMWVKNIADFAKDYRVYTVDLIGQPGKSTPDKTFKGREDLVPWFTGLLDALKISQASLAPDDSHDLSSFQARAVAERILEFLRK